MPELNLHIKQQLPDEWANWLTDELNRSYIKELEEFVSTQYAENVVFPPFEQIFSAYWLTSFSDVKVVIVGQDPYHGKGQANGLAFSVNKGIKIPPSLKNIFKELQSDLKIQIPDHGDLTGWAKQGVFLINATLTVLEKKAGSHQKKGWEQFTDAVIKTISDKKDAVVFMLWGNYAISKEKLIDPDKHYILKSVHPSPLSAFNGFFGCKHFSKSNDWLASKKIQPINWQIQNQNPQLNFL